MNTIRNIRFLAALKIDDDKTFPVSNFYSDDFTFQLDYKSYDVLSTDGFDSESSFEFHAQNPFSSAACRKKTSLGNKGKERD